MFFDIISRKAEDEEELDIEEDGRSRKKPTPERDVMVFNNEIYSPDSRSTSSG